MKYFVIILFNCSIINVAFGQDVKQDWKDFNKLFWKVTFFNDVKYPEFLGAKKVGELKFQHRLNPKIATTYYVLNKSDIDSTYKNKLGIRSYMDSCEPSGFTSFTFKDFYYVPGYCSGCIQEKSKKCKKLDIRMIMFLNKNRSNPIYISPKK